MAELQSLLQQFPHLIRCCVSLMLVAFLWRSFHHLQSILSYILNFWLSKSKRITNNHDSDRQLPSLPYTWPNGQGNLAKFIHGRENSKAWRDKYGVIYQIWAGMKPEVVLTRAHDIYTVFKDSHNHVKAVDNNSGYVLSRLLGSCLGLVSGSEWQKIHDVFQPYFTRTSSQQYLEIISRQVKTHIDVLHQKIHSGDVKQLDTVSDLKILPFSIIAEIIYGPLPSHLFEELTSLIPLRERVFAYAISGGMTRFRCFSWLPLRSLRQLHEFEKRWSTFNDAVYEYQSSNLNLLSISIPTVIPLYHAMHKGTLSRPQLLQTIDEILFANIDVTIGAMSWCLIFLAKFPDTDDKIREEFQIHLTSNSISPSPPPPPDDLSNNLHPAASSIPSSHLTSSKTYLSAFIHESSRHRPLAAFSVPQSAPTPRNFHTPSSPTNTSPASYTIPKGTDYIIDSNSLNIHDIEYWGPDTYLFRPERFLEKWGVINEQTPTRPAAAATTPPPPSSRSNNLRYHYWRFGFGPRQCLGRYIADLMLRCLLVEVVVRFDLNIETDPTIAEKTRTLEDGTKHPDDDDDESGWERDMETWILHPTTKIGCRVRGQQSSESKV